MSRILGNLFVAIIVLSPLGCSRETNTVPPASNRPAAGGLEPQSDDSLRTKDTTVAESADDIADMDEAASAPPASNPLIRGLQQTIDAIPGFRGQDEELQQSLVDADRLLSDIKQENRDALREMNRQVLAGPRPVNLVLVVADDLGLGDLGCYGHPTHATPHLDQMAGEGVRFTEFYAGGPTNDASWWCLMTGRYTAHSNQSRAVPLNLSHNEFTLSEVMWQGGYETAFLGNWCLSASGRDGMPHLHGFDEWTGTLFSETNVTLYPETILNDGVQARVTANSGGEQALCIDEFYTQEALSYLQRHRTGRPFLLVMAYTIPRRCPADLAGTASAAGSTEPAEPSDPHAARAAAVAALDQQVGKILTQLQQLGLDRQTAVFVTSDTAGKHPSTAGQGSSSGSLVLRGVKGELYEGGLRVPLLARWPGQFAAGTVSEYPAAIWDLLPTCAELGHVARKPPGLDGVSLVSVLRGATPERTQRMYWESLSGGDSQAVRIGKWKAVRPAGKDKLSDVELYDLSQDPGESTNIASKHPDIIEQVLNTRSQ